MTKDQKVVAIQEIKDLLQDAKVVYVADLEGLNAGKSSDFRRQAFKRNIKVKVVKNTLLQKAMEQIEGVDYSEMFQTFKGNSALMISERKQFANWSETGSGKTISGVLTSRYIDSKITLIFAVNSTVSNWTENAIRQAYHDSKVYTKTHISENTKLDTNFYNYIVVNYEEFQKYFSWVED